MGFNLFRKRRPTSAQDYINQVSTEKFKRQEYAGRFGKQPKEMNAEQILKISTQPKLRIKIFSRQERDQQRRQLAIVEKREARRVAYRSFARQAERRGNRLFSALRVARRRQLITARDIRRPAVGSGLKNPRGKRGRPVGSYDPRYRAYGGVYGYRKILNAQLRVQRLQNLRNIAINPQQQMILQQIEARNQYQQTNPENQIIPDTAGAVPTRSIHQEIDDAANAFP